MPDGGLATIGDVIAAKAAAAEPVQIWSCSNAEHRHIAKADAVRTTSANRAVIRCPLRMLEPFIIQDVVVREGPLFATRNPGGQIRPVRDTGS